MDLRYMETFIFEVARHGMYTSSHLPCARWYLVLGGTCAHGGTFGNCSLARGESRVIRPSRESCVIRPNRTRKVGKLGSNSIILPILPHTFMRDASALFPCLTR